MGLWGAAVLLGNTPVPPMENLGINNQSQLVQLSIGTKLPQWENDVCVSTNLWNHSNWFTTELMYDELESEWRFLLCVVPVPCLISGSPCRQILRRCNLRNAMGPNQNYECNSAANIQGAQRRSPHQKRSEQPLPGE